MRRLIGLIVIFALFLVFIVVNLENKSDISVGFYTFQDIPVYLSVFISVVLGMVLAFFIALYSSKQKNAPPSEKPGKTYKRRGRTTKNQPARLKDQDGAYGID